MFENTYVIIPSLDPDEHLKETVRGLKAAGFCHFVLVDDGSDEEHRQNFPQATKSIAVLHHKVNYGKGKALKTAFKYIAKNCPDCKYMVTVDGDGQHTPEDAKKCVEALGDNENLCVLGARCFKQDNVPLRSKIGNNITLFVFHQLCGIKISDTQTGLRAFPVSLIPMLLKIEGSRFDYETNMLLKFKQRGVEISEVPIETVYIEENHASHFRTIQDSVLVYKFIISYLLASVISFVVDISLFFLLSKIFADLPVVAMTFLATGIARLFSSLLNYNLNKRKVFDYEDEVDETNKHTLLKYYTLAIPQMCVSAGFVTLIVKLIPVLLPIETLIKVVVDTIIFLVNYRVQRSWVFAQKDNQNMEKETTKKERIASDYIDSEEAVESKPKKAKKKPNYVGRVFLCIGTALLMFLITVYAVCFMIANGPSQTACKMAVLSAKQASATKWVPGLFMSKDRINKILKDSQSVNADTVSVDELATEDDEEWEDAIDGMKLIWRQESKFKAYVLLVKDPSRVKLGVSSDNFYSGTQGLRYFEIAEKYNAMAVINGGEFPDPGNGSNPIGITYCNGKCVWASPTDRSFFGFDNDNNLVCLEGLTQAKAEELGIRDGCCFQWGNVLITHDGDNVNLLYSDNNVGTSQRTAIGQRADGTVIMIVTDGRTTESIGATRNDMIDLMVEYGAITAGMLDGGSSAVLYYRDYITKYNVDRSTLDENQLNGLVNTYKAFTSPRRIPTYFVVTGEG